MLKIPKNKKDTTVAYSEDSVKSFENSPYLVSAMISPLIFKNTPTQIVIFSNLIQFLKKVLFSL